MLGVITSQLGASFVTRHVEEIYPGRTVAVSRYRGHPLQGLEYEAPCPVFWIQDWNRSLGARLKRRVGIEEGKLLQEAASRFFRKHEVSVVLGQYLDHTLDFVPGLDAHGIPYVVQGHGIDVSQALRDPVTARRIQCYESARAVLTRSSFHRDRLIGLGLPEDRVHVNPGGVDVPAVIPEKEESANKRFLAVGRMATKKAPILLLESFRRAWLEDSELRLDVVGDGPLFPAVRQFVEGTGISEAVRLHGVASEAVKITLLSECGVFVQHSITDPDTGDEEGLPAAIQEAMANGLAVISTRHSGIPEAVAEGTTGLLVKEGDVQGMAQAMLSIQDCCQEFGRAGHERALERYTWEGERDRLRNWLGLS